MSEIVIYQTADQHTELEVQFDGDTVWLNQEQLVLLFDRDQSVISRHIRNAFKEGELMEKSNMQKMHIANSDKPVAFFNLDVIISVGYRVKSKRGTQYAVNPEFIRKINFKGKTNLKNIEDYRLEELVFKDLTAYPKSGFGEIHQRIGMEINGHTVKRILKRMVLNDALSIDGSKRWAKYSIKQKL
jgi:hypothetical protein